MSPCGCQDLVLKWAAVRVGHGAGASASHNCCAGREGTHEGRYLLEFFLGADVPDGTRHGKGAQRAASDADRAARTGLGRIAEASSVFCTRGLHDRRPAWCHRGRYTPEAASALEKQILDRALEKQILDRAVPPIATTGCH